MNNLDILLLSIMLVCFAAGLKSGLIRQVFFVVSVVGGLVLGFVFRETLGGYLVGYNVIADPKIASGAGFVLVASLAYLFMQIVSWLLTDLIRKLGMGWVNNLMGATLGAVVGVLLCHLVIVGISQFADEDSAFLENSVLAPKVVFGYNMLRERAPGKLEEPLEKMREFREETGQPPDPD